jgi:hypothetical protein
MSDYARLTGFGLTRACGDIIPYRRDAPIILPSYSLLSPRQTRQALQDFEQYRYFFLDYVNLCYTVIDK